jgi:hypothetical protein
MACSQIHYIKLSIIPIEIIVSGALIYDISHTKPMADYTRGIQHAYHIGTFHPTRPLPFNGVEHTRDRVVPMIAGLGYDMGYRGDDLMLIMTAGANHNVALFRPANGHGDLVYRQSEAFSAPLAASFLSYFGYTTREISNVVDWIRQMQPINDGISMPGTMPAKVICDAHDSWYAGVDFPVLNAKLYEEQVAHGLDVTKNEWDKKQLDILDRLRFRTSVGQARFEEGRRRNAEDLERII